MTPETRFVLVNLDAVAAPRVLAIGCEPDVATALAHTGVEHVTALHNDLRAHRTLLPLAARRPNLESRFAPWLDLPSSGEGPAGRGHAGPGESFDAALIIQPKAMERLEMLATMVCGVVRPGGRVVVAGHNDAGIKGAGRRLRTIFGVAEVLDYRYHCRAYRATVSDTPPPGIPPARARLDGWRAETAVEVRGVSLTIVTYPGVFSHGRLDAGTRLLLDALALPPDARVLDAGCGSGCVGAWLRLAGQAGAVVCADVDALALAACEETLAANRVTGAAVAAADLFDAVPGPYTHVVCNAPFHEGIRASNTVAGRLIRETPAHLQRGGELWLVANRHLRYLPVLEGAFAAVEVAAEDSRYRVYRARR